LIVLSGSLLLVLFFIFSPLAWSQAPGEAEETLSEGLKYFDFFVVKGGWIAYVLILISVVMVAFAIEHAITIRRATILPPEAATRVRELLAEKKYGDALQFTREDPSVLGYVLHAGLFEAANGFDAMERAVEEAVDERSARLFRKIEYLNIIGNVSPMIGLFGTVYGMILLFAEIHAADGLPGARIVVDRMAVALITTFWGLAVAIPALSIYAFFRNRIDVLTAECALAVDRLLSVFGPGGGFMDAATTKPAAPPPSAASGLSRQVGVGA
jgi:biopolymer transport protein ExbB